MMLPTFLTEILREARFTLWVVAVSCADDAATSWSRAGLTVRTLRGAKMRSTDALMDEVAAALQFPSYFGENWAALDECLSDMEWLLPSSGIVLLVRDAEVVLCDEDIDSLRVFVGALNSALEEYGEPVALGEAWDRPAIPFHVVLQASVDDANRAAQRWIDAGAQLVDC